MKPISELSIEELKDALLNGYRFLDRALQVRQEINAIEQEMAKREEPKPTK
jgi:hypothetical protein